MRFRPFRRSFQMSPCLVGGRLFQCMFFFISMQAAGVLRANWGCLLFYNSYTTVGQTCTRKEACMKQLTRKIAYIF